MRLWVNTIAVHSYISVTLFFFSFFCYSVSFMVLSHSLEPVMSHLKSLQARDACIWKKKKTTVLCCLFGLVLLHSYLGHLRGLDILVGSVYHWTICLFYPNQAGRLLLRRVVCEKIGVPWSEIRLERSPRGKPYLASPVKVPVHSRCHSMLQSLLLHLSSTDLY